jgi:hypothetical protein
VKIIGLPKETPSLIEASKLCSSTVFSSIGTLNRLHKFLKWVQPGVAAVYKGNEHDSLVDRRVGTIVMRASVNRGQFRNMPPELTGTWLRHIYLCDEEGMARVSMYVPMKSMNIIRPDVLILFLHMCSNTAIAPLVNAATSYIGHTHNYLVTTDDNTTPGTGAAFMFNQDATNTVTMDISRLFYESVAGLVDLVCESIMSLVVKKPDVELFRRVARIKNRARLFEPYSNLPFEDLDTIGLTFNSVYHYRAGTES